jgi:cytochrome c oxidase subunit 3
MSAAVPERRLRTDPANGLLGAVCFVLAEAMFFLGLVFVTLHIRHDAAGWAPPGSPRLHTALLLANTAVLLASGVTMLLAVGAVRRGDRAALRRWLAVTTALGSAFLAGQLVEFLRLGGWRPAEGIYRTLFDVLAGLHGLHVAAGVGLLAVVLWRARLGQLTPDRHLAVSAGALYWSFVTAVWLVLLAALMIA